MRELAFALVLAAALASPAPAAQGSPAGKTPATAAAARADAARLAHRTEEAIALYREALGETPEWAEGWFHLGMLLYDRDLHAEAAPAFERATSLQPSVGTAWVMLGLCEFRLGRHDAALAHIRKGRQQGTPRDPQFRRVMLYHEGLLWLGRGEFERAQETLDVLGAEGVDDDDLVAALGLSVLRVRPSDAPPSGDGRRAIEAAGRAELLAARKRRDEARQAYEQLAAEFSDIANVQYALGRFYAADRQPERAVQAYERELAVSPNHVPARLGIAAIKARTDPDEALRLAEEAVRLNPRVPLAHYLLGSLLTQTPQIDRAIAELEIAERAVKEDPQLYYVLGQAYARAGRKAEAARALEQFRRLNEEQQKEAQIAPQAAEGEEPGPQ